MQTFTILNVTSLPGGYCELTLQSGKELSPLPEPGRYVRAALARETPRLSLPILKVQSADTFQVLSRSSATRGTELLNARIEGETPAPDPARAHVVLVSAESALACSVFAAERLRRQYALTVFAELNDPAPFKPVPSQILMPACPPGAIAAIPLFDSWNIPSRLASSLEQSGFYHGAVTGLLESWWGRLDKEEHFRLQILGFGDKSFLQHLGNWCDGKQIPLQTAEIPI